MATARERKIARDLDQLFRFITDHDRWIAEMRSRVARDEASLYDSQAPNNATAVGRHFLGNLRWIFEYAQANNAAANNALSALGMVRSEVNALLIAYRDAFRIYRDANKNNAAQLTAALNTLEAALPDVSSIFSTTAPSDWV